MALRQSGGNEGAQAPDRPGAGVVKLRSCYAEGIRRAARGGRAWRRAALGRPVPRGRVRRGPAGASLPAVRSRAGAVHSAGGAARPVPVARPWGVPEDARPFIGPELQAESRFPAARSTHMLRARSRGTPDQPTMKASNNLRPALLAVISARPRRVRRDPARAHGAARTAARRRADQRRRDGRRPARHLPRGRLQRGVRALGHAARAVRRLRRVRPRSRDVHGERRDRRAARSRAARCARRR